MGETSVKAASGRSSPEVLAAQAAQAALRNLRRICQDPDQRAQDRIAAAKVLLEYGGIKPAD